jgi:hypothetical protein
MRRVRPWFAEGKLPSWGRRLNATLIKLHANTARNEKNGEDDGEWQITPHGLFFREKGHVVKPARRRPIRSSISRRKIEGELAHRLLRQLFTMHIDPGFCLRRGRADLKLACLNRGNLFHRHLFFCPEKSAKMTSKQA